MVGPSWSLIDSTRGHQNPDLRVQFVKLKNILQTAANELVPENSRTWPRVTFEPSKFGIPYARSYPVFQRLLR